LGASCPPTSIKPNQAEFLFLGYLIRHVLFQPPG